jgi:TatD DNase family protein
MIDFHCHIDLFPDPGALVAECERAGVQVLSVTTTPSAWQGTLALAPKSEFIRTALGLHPELAHERYGELTLFDRLLPKARYVGEIGLDHSRGTEVRWPFQQRVLSHILSSCQAAGGRIMSLHSRQAAKEVLDQLESFPGAGTAILHWFTGTIAELERAIALGCWFSVGPAMLGGAKGRALALRMPMDRLLTESDGPFAVIQGKPASPMDTCGAVRLLAELRGQTAHSVTEQLTGNLDRLEQRLPRVSN